MDKLDKFSNKIDALTLLVNQYLVNVDQKTDDQPKAFIYTLAYKTNNGLYSVNLLIKDMLYRPRYCDSIFLILRTMLSDAITYFYLLTISQDEIDGDDIFVDAINRLDADHLRYSFNNLRLFQLLYKETDKSIEGKRALTRSRYPSYFNADGRFKTELRMESIAEMVAVVAKSNLDFIIRPVTNAFKLYDIFSKYEHLGMLTTHLITRQFEKPNQEQILGEVYLAIKTVLTLQNSLLTSFLDAEEMKAFENLLNEIVEIKIYEVN